MADADDGWASAEEFNNEPEPSHLPTKREKKKKRKKRKGSKGFHTLRMWMTDPSEGEQKATRTLYFKRHTSTQHSEEGASDAVVFVLNLPCDFDNANVENVFSVYGSVLSVVFTEYQRVPGIASDKPRNAHVTFEDEESIDKLISVSEQDVVAAYEPPRLATGMQKWVAQYYHERPDVSKLQQQVGRFMEAFDRQVKEEKANLETKEIDEDGFELVKRKSRKLRGSVLPISNARPKKKKKAPVINFYKNQKREQQQKKLALLRQKFEEDKERIVEMRKQRKFKPY